MSLCWFCRVVAHIDDSCFILQHILEVVIIYRQLCNSDSCYNSGKTILDPHYSCYGPRSAIGRAPDS